MCVCGGLCVLVAAGALGGGAFGAGAAAQELGSSGFAKGGGDKHAPGDAPDAPDAARSAPAAQTLWDPFWGHLETLAKGVVALPQHAVTDDASTQAGHKEAEETARCPCFLPPPPCACVLWVAPGRPRCDAHIWPIRPPPSHGGRRLSLSRARRTHVHQCCPRQQAPSPAVVEVCHSSLHTFCGACRHGLQACRGGPSLSHPRSFLAVADTARDLCAARCHWRRQSRQN